ncbi:MAG: hemerythrin family protein [Magnetospirillum gryphiswaldense]|uniref:bacteriohemerythrin n=1 Tax=Magnetospirillum sp. 64-120 TaxID=1895778 RepID=UPI000929C4E1|nr:bacteriohemerythrin [Magnetospirillum sp. 64-120]MBI2239828.1 hemerythrin family protein [Magnetospirillum gryphiswaldense]OJX80950.1 MAG: hemerythrin [Magnetospirillum sp. 64-120]
MPFIQWDKSFSVGTTALDADHRRLLEILNRIYEAWQTDPSKVELDQLFDELLDYTDGHFNREESKLAARDYQNLAEHQLQHERLRETVLAFRARHLAGNTPDALTEDMANFLKSWLMDHILGEDMKYKTLFTGRL